MPRSEHKVGQRNHHYGHEDRAGPIEACRIDRGGLRPEAPEEGPESVDDGHDVDGNAPFAEGKVGRWESFGVVDAAPEDAADREAVALKESNSEKGVDGVERDGAYGVKRSAV